MNHAVFVYMRNYLMKNVKEEKSERGRTIQILVVGVVFGSLLLAILTSLTMVVISSIFPSLKEDVMNGKVLIGITLCGLAIASVFAIRAYKKWMRTLQEKENEREKIVQDIATYDPSATKIYENVTITKCNDTKVRYTPVCSVNIKLENSETLSEIIAVKSLVFDYICDYEIPAYKLEKVYVNNGYLIDLVEEAATKKERLLQQQVTQK